MYTRIMEGVGFQSSVGHRSIGRIWEYDFSKCYKVKISPCFYCYPVDYMILKCVYKSPITIFQRWKMTE